MITKGATRICLPGKNMENNFLRTNYTHTRKIRQTKITKKNNNKQTKKN